MKEKSKELFKSYREFLDNDRSIYQNLGYAVYNAYQGNIEKSIEYMKLFAREENIQYWIVLFLEGEPALDTALKNPEFKKSVEEMKTRFWNTHQQLKSKLEEKGLIES